MDGGAWTSCENEADTACAPDSKDSNADGLSFLNFCIYGGSQEKPKKFDGVKQFYNKVNYPDRPTYTDVPSNKICPALTPAVGPTLWWKMFLFFYQIFLYYYI